MSRSFFISNHGKFKIVLVLMLLGLPLAMVLISLAIVSSKAVGDKASLTERHRASTLPAVVPRGPVQIVRFTLYDVGIYPDEARVQPGLVAILLEDLSGSRSEIIIERVENAQRTEIGRVRQVANRLRSRQEMMLTPGEYWISEAQQPDKRALLIVEN